MDILTLNKTEFDKDEIKKEFFYGYEEYKKHNQFFGFKLNVIPIIFYKRKAYVELRKFIINDLNDTYSIINTISDNSILYEIEKPKNKKEFDLQIPSIFDSKINYPNIHIIGKLSYDEMVKISSDRDNNLYTFGHILPKKDGTTKLLLDGKDINDKLEKYIKQNVLNCDDTLSEKERAMYSLFMILMSFKNYNTNNKKSLIKWLYNKTIEAFNAYDENPKLVSKIIYESTNILCRYVTDCIDKNESAFKKNSNLYKQFFDFINMFFTSDNQDSQQKLEEYVFNKEYENHYQICNKIKQLYKQKKQFVYWG